MSARIFSIIVAVIIGCNTTAKAKTPHRVPKVTETVTVDAVLNEPLWKDALKLEIGYEVRPAENIPSPVKTEVYLAYGPEHLYAAFVAYDPNPSQIRAHLTDRDQMYADDWVVLILDTFNDERRTFDYFCNPLGVQGDQIECPGGGGDSWDVIWDSDGRITAEGFVVEMAIPFSSIPFQYNEEDQIWGIDLVRNYPRNVRHHLGMFPRDRNNNCYMCQAEKLVGFAGIAPGKNIELDPTISSTYSQDRPDFPGGKMTERDKSLDPGVTARWSFTPNLVLSTTINPDFSQVEADAAQLDINEQFAIDYPEKRPFFVEGADLFHTLFRGVNTRTLADPDWGIKLTGKEGARAIGLFSVRDNITNLIFPGNQGSNETSLSMSSVSSAVRYRHDVGRSSNLGVLIPDREGVDYYNRVAGLDADLRPTSKDHIQAQVLGSKTSYPESVATEFDQPIGSFDGTAECVSYTHSTRNFALYTSAKNVDPDFRADLGHIPWAGYRSYWIGPDYTWYASPGKWWSEFMLSAFFQRLENDDGDLLKRIDRVWLTYEGVLESHAIIQLERIREVYNGTRYKSDLLFLHNCMNPIGGMHAWVNLELGDQIDYGGERLGKILSADGGIEYRFGLHWQTDLRHTYERLKVGNELVYTANISRAKIVYQFSKRALLRTIVQYLHYDESDDLYEELTSQVLFSYKINPQTVLFLGYSDLREGAQDFYLTQRERTIFAKVGYAWVL